MDEHILTPGNEAQPGRRRAATIIEVARHADVSVGTVSRFLNGYSVRNEKRDRIKLAIDVLKYNRNAVAQAMRTDRTNMVAMLLPGYDEFFSGVLTHITKILSDEGLVLLTHEHRGEASGLGQALEFFQNHRVGAIIMPGMEAVRPQVNALLEQGIPVIFYNNDCPGLPVDRVFSNGREGSRQAVRHLHDLGHRQIGIIAGLQEETSAVDRLEGYRQGMRECGLPVDPDYETGWSWQRRHAGFDGMEALVSLPKPPTAVLASNYVLALGALDCMKGRDLQVGKDISLITYDDVDFLKFITPSISAIAQPAAAIGQHIAEIVLQKLKRGRPTAPRTVYLDCSIILRESTKPPSV